MNENLELLNYIYQNAKMGVTGIEDILRYIEDKELKKHVIEQLDDYTAIAKKAITYFIEHGKKEKELSTMLKITSYLSINMKSMMDNSTSSLAKMLTEGSNKGIMDITKNINKYQNVDDSIKKLANDLLKIEQKNLEKLKPFL